jgi:hypothetical protein
MFATLKRTWDLIDGETHKRVPVKPGRYELDRIFNPFGHIAPWLVLKGTKIGQAEGAWRDWRNGMINNDGKPIDWGEFEIVIED